MGICCYSVLWCVCVCVCFLGFFFAVNFFLFVFVLFILNLYNILFFFVQNQMNELQEYRFVIVLLIIIINDYEKK